MQDFGIWVAIATLFIALVGQWVRVNMNVTRLEAKAAADKITCDASMALLRSEVVAVETRGNAGLRGLTEQIGRLDGKIDTLLQRHS